MAQFFDPDAVRSFTVRCSRRFKSIKNKENDMLSSKEINRISQLKASGLSERKISEKLGIARNTLSKYSDPKIITQILKRNEQGAEKIERIKGAIIAARQDTKTLRRETKTDRKQQDRADDAHHTAWYKQQAIEEEAESAIYTAVKQARETMEYNRRMAMAQPKWDLEHPDDSFLHKLLIAMALRR